MNMKRQRLKKMMKIREFEKEIKNLHHMNLVEGAIHCYTGEEAIAVGVCENLLESDYVFSTHRGHGHAIAMNCDLNAIFAELMGKETGLSGGMGGSMHLFDVKKGLMGGNGIVAGGITLAVGTAYASKYRNDTKVTICFFSEGASNEGWCHEAMNMASLWKLPVIFACENNLFAATTPSFKTLSHSDIYKRAESYQMRGVCVDGNDVDDCVEKSKEAIDLARNGQGPSLLEFKTYRVEGHCMVLKDLPVHRPKKEVESWAERDPITIYQNKLIDRGEITLQEIEEIRGEISREFDRAVAFGQESSRPNLDDFMEKINARYHL